MPALGFVVPLHNFATVPIQLAAALRTRLSDGTNLRTAFATLDQRHFESFELVTRPDARDSAPLHPANDEDEPQPAATRVRRKEGTQLKRS